MFFFFKDNWSTFLQVLFDEHKCSHLAPLSSLFFIWQSAFLVCLYFLGFSLSPSAVSVLCWAPLSCCLLCQASTGDTSAETGPSNSHKKPFLPSFQNGIGLHTKFRPFTSPWQVASSGGSPLLLCLVWLFFSFLHTWVSLYKTFHNKGTINQQSEKGYRENERHF